MFVKQLVFCVLGLVLFWVGLRVPPRAADAGRTAGCCACIVLLVAVLIPGSARVLNGSRSWFALGPLSLQPSETAKVALALWGAHVLVAKRAAAAPLAAPALAGGAGRRC